MPHHDDYILNMLRFQLDLKVDIKLPFATNIITVK